MKHPILQATWAQGQSVWLDFIDRKIMNSGELETLIREGLRGMTSNPTIFQQAIAGGMDYDKDVREGVTHDWSAEQTFEHLAVQDIIRAADMLRSVYDESMGTDGFVSLEVSPKLAHDTNGTVNEARRLWKKVDRPNLMIKVPGTDEGIPAIRVLLGEGMNINITLLFSLAQYRAVLATYLDAMEARVASGNDTSRVASVASFFVSRVDASADKKLESKGKSELTGKAAIANACIAYRHFKEVTAGERWKKLAAKGAHVQRPLWASTSTKNPSYPDTLYVQELVARDTVNTVPPVTLAAWKDHGRPMASLERNLEIADKILGQIRDAGVDLEKVTHDLIEDGVKKFEQSYDQLLDAIRQKRRVVTGETASM